MLFLSLSSNCITLLVSSYITAISALHLFPQCFVLSPLRQSSYFPLRSWLRLDTCGHLLSFFPYPLPPHLLKIPKLSFSFYPAVRLQKRVNVTFYFYSSYLTENIRFFKIFSSVHRKLISLYHWALVRPLFYTLGNITNISQLSNSSTVFHLSSFNTYFISTFLFLPLVSCHIFYFLYIISDTPNLFFLTSFTLDFHSIQDDQLRGLLH